jgi:hypothetical protein
MLIFADPESSVFATQFLIGRELFLLPLAWLTFWEKNDGDENRILTALLP